jgi:two-component system sensor histidine kinase TctE
LALARPIAERHQGALRLEARDAGSGLHAILWWPRTR